MSSELEIDDSTRETSEIREDHSGDSEPVAQEEPRLDDSLTAILETPLCHNAVSPTASFDDTGNISEEKTVPLKDEVFEQIMAVWWNVTNENGDTSAIRSACRNVEKKI